MTGQGARDDEREALIAEAMRRTTDLDVTTNPPVTRAFIRRLGIALESAHRELLAARKHPEPEMEYGRLTIYGDQVMSELAVGDREEAELMVADGRRLEATEREDVRFRYEIARRTKAVPAGPWVPVGEGEQGDG